MPKSGTWLSQYFFWALKQYIKIENFHPEKCDFNKIKVGNFISFDNSSLLLGMLHAQVMSTKSQTNIWKNGRHLISGTQDTIG